MKKLRFCNQTFFNTKAYPENLQNEIKYANKLAAVNFY